MSKTKKSDEVSNAIVLDEKGNADWDSMAQEIDDTPQWLPDEPTTVEIVNFPPEKIEYTKVDNETGKEYPAVKYKFKIIQRDGSEGYIFTTWFGFKEIVKQFKVAGKGVKSINYRHTGYNK